MCIGGHRAAFVVVSCSLWGPLFPPGAEEPEVPPWAARRHWKPKDLLDARVDDTLEDPIPWGAPAAEEVPA